MFNLLNTLSERLSTTNNKMAEMVDSFVIKNRLFVLSQTLSRIMHDVRAPLTSIFISTQMMEEDLPEAKDYIRDISISSEKISNILEEIVEFVKGSSPELYFDKYKSSEIVENIELYFKLLTKFKKLHLHIDNDAPEYYYLDIVRFRRLMENLIRNSINALNPDGNLYIKLYGRENYIKVSISDDGPGLPEEKIPFMFEPFKSGYPAKGKGIGLAICKKIVDDHGGSIVYKTSPEGGAQFDIELPIIVTESTINS
jgi:signal transduction histidine kinase